MVLWLFQIPILPYPVRRRLPRVNHHIGLDIPYHRHLEESDLCWFELRHIVGVPLDLLELDIECLPVGIDHDSIYQSTRRSEIRDPVNIHASFPEIREYLRLEIFLNMSWFVEVSTSEGDIIDLPPRHIILSHVVFHKMNRRDNCT